MSEIYAIYDDRFNALINPDATLEQLWTGGIWCEGPACPDEESVIWSDIPNNRMLRWHQTEGVSVFRKPANFTNGHTIDHQGRLVSCEHGRRCVSRTEADGSVVILVDNYHGLRLNSPNDLVVKSDGTIWFTDPFYGMRKDTPEGYQAPPEVPGCFVYRYDPENDELRTVATDFVQPNGIAFSPDEKRLYVSDTSISHDPTGNHHIRVFDVVNDDSLTNGRVFAEVNPGLSDGFRFDASGHLFTSAGDGIHVYAEDGDLLGKILVPEVVANCNFGGPDKSRLFITATTSLYVIDTHTQGV